MANLMSFTEKMGVGSAQSGREAWSVNAAENGATPTFVAQGWWWGTDSQTHQLN